MTITKAVGKRKKKITVGTVALYAVLTLIGFICLYPFLNVLAYSFSGYNAVLSGKVTFLPIDFNLDAYKEILHKAQIWIAMNVTLLVTFCGTIIGLILTVFAAYGLSRENLPGKKALSGIILFTMYFSGGII
ncbi:MAG: ABC transporter permease, partial [Lachnoclostridium edouardi]|nr:ABC transporter permease [Lachnoclostridium edouardi]